MNPVKNARLTLALGLFAIGSWACATDRTGPTQTRPNIVVILADDLGVETLACYGGESYRTPNLDRLAREGVRFEHAYSQPLCTPARVEVLTGRSSARNYRAFSVLDSSERTFANELQDAGYRTFAAGKWQLYGAEHYPESVRATGTLPPAAGFDQHALWQVESLGDRYWGPTITVDGETQTLDAESYGPDVVLRHALEWIDAGGDEPFLLYWPMILPHAPFLATPRSTGPHQEPGDVAQYGSMVEYVDTLVGRFTKALRERGLQEDTIVLFLGDNGSPREAASYRDGRVIVGGKGRPTDSGTHVPFLAWGPGRLTGGVEVEEPISTVDVFATVLDAARVPLPTDRELDSWSLLPRLTGESGPNREAVTFHYHPRPVTEPDSAPTRWARDVDWQLFDDGRLYHVAVDPRLSQPISAEREGPDAAAARERLERALATLPES